MGWKGNGFWVCTLIDGRAGLCGLAEARERLLCSADEGEEDGPHLAMVFSGDFRQKTIEERGKTQEGRERRYRLGTFNPRERLPRILPDGGALLGAAHPEETEEAARLGGVELRGGDGKRARRLLGGG